MAIEKQTNGIYTWSCSIDAEYHRNSIRPGLYMCIGFAVFLLIYGGVLSSRFHDPMSFWIVAACVGVFLLIVAIVFGLAFSAADPQETYVLTDTYLKIGYGKSSVFFDFKKLDRVDFHEQYIELREKKRSALVYTATKEDMEFVREYITSRVSGDTKVYFY